MAEIVKGWPASTVIPVSVHGCWGRTTVVCTDCALAQGAAESMPANIATPAIRRTKDARRDFMYEPPGANAKKTARVRQERNRA